MNQNPHCNHEWRTIRHASGWTCEECTKCGEWRIPFIYMLVVVIAIGVLILAFIAWVLGLLVI